MYFVSAASSLASHFLITSFSVSEDINIYSSVIMNRLTSDGPASKNSMCSAGDTGDVGLIPESGISSEERNVNLLQYYYIKKSHKQRTLADYSPKGCKALDTTEQLSTLLLINILLQTFCSVSQHPL